MVNRPLCLNHASHTGTPTSSADFNEENFLFGIKRKNTWNKTYSVITPLASPFSTFLEGMVQLKHNQVLYELVNMEKTKEKENPAGTAVTNANIFVRLKANFLNR